MKSRQIAGLFLSLLLLITFWGCEASTPQGENSFTHGAVQLNLKKGETTQTDVLNKFGAPNVATLDAEGFEVWNYQKHARVTQSSGGHATIVIAGASGGTVSESTKTMTLIIKFNGDKVVSDFKSLYTSF